MGYRLKAGSERVRYVADDPEREERLLNRHVGPADRGE